MMSINHGSDSESECTGSRGKRYNQQKEGLAIVFGVNKFHQSWACHPVKTMFLTQDRI